MRKSIKSFAAACTVVAVWAIGLAGCMHPTGGGPQIVAPSMDDYEKPLPPGALALRQIDASDIDFTPAGSDLAGMRQAIDFSLSYLGKPSAHRHFPYRVNTSTGEGAISHAQAVASLNAFARMIDSGMTGSQINEAIHAQFDVYISVGCDGRGTVLYTGYYTPIFDGSLTRTERFRYPLYRMPAGMVKNDDGSPKTAMPDRRAIEQANMFAGNELVWLSDPFEVYVAHVQGSAKVRLADNRLMTVGYTANNGHEYRSVRSDMVKDGKIGKRDGLASMIAYFKAHPEDVANYVSRNPRFIFFAEVPDGRPRGCLNEPVTTRRTLATDKTVFPRACMTFMSTKMPAGSADVPYSAFTLDQDAGGAIRAAGRADIYLGVGPQAGDLAGRTMSEGRLYYLFLKPTAVAAAGW